MATRFLAGYIIVMSTFAIPTASAYARPVKFDIKPENAVVEYVPSHYFLKCKAGSSENPWKHCGGWKAVVNGAVVDLSGEYCVQARWENGKSAKMSFSAGTGTKTIKLKVRPSTLAPGGTCQ
jgi:hypothetical protein